MELIDILKKEKLSFSELKEKLNIDDLTLSKMISPLENKVIFKNKQAKYELIDESLNYGYIIFKDDRVYIKSLDKTYLVNEYVKTKNLYPNDEYLFSVSVFYDQEMANLEKFICHSKEPLLFKKGKRFFLRHKAGRFSSVKVLNVPNDIKEGTYILARPLFKRENNMEQFLFERVCLEAKEYDEDIFNMIVEAKVPYIFSKEYQSEIDKIEDVSDKDLEGRKDYTDKIIFTIDGDDSKDFDDAVSIEVLDNGNYLVGVHIADVSYYVKEDSIIDKEALKRGTSIYLANKVIPMLGEKLSNDLCSLNENKIRLTLSCMMEFDEFGRKVDYKLYESYIKSKRRMTYNICNKMLNGDEELIEEYQDIYPSLVKLNELAIILRAKRKKNGSIFFESEEMKVLFDKNDNVTGIVKVYQDKAEELIEEFMLEANNSVANYLNNLDYPAIYRVHDEANHEKLKELKGTLTSLGLHLNLSGSGVKSKDIQKVLDEVKGTPASLFVSDILLRSMAKAVYSSECLGHFGLAMKEYLHFTSPIRRYPDLFVHRILHNLVFNNTDFKAKYDHFNGISSTVANISTNCEIRATKLERDVLDHYLCVYANKMEDTKYHGYINSIVEYGMYITLDNGIEGLAHVKSFDEYLDYDPAKKVLIGNMTNDCYNIGDEVMVRIYDVNIEKRYIDFKVVYHKRVDKK